MAGPSKIEWSTDSWNPIVGCSLVSPGCTGCYAMGQAARLLDGNPKTPHYAGTTKRVKGVPVWTGKLALAPDHIMKQPLRWTRPRVIFVNSMGDLFHNNLPDAWIDKVFAIMALCPSHTFQVLTKRPERMLAYFADLTNRAKAIGNALASMLESDWIDGEGRQYVQPIEAMVSLAFGLAPTDQALALEDFLPLPNVWLGTSVEDQRRANERMPFLVKVPAAVRFVSAEPLLGEVDLSRWLAVHDVRLQGRTHWTERTGEMAKIEWVIAGGESGKNARPMHPDWARLLRNQCAAAGVPFFFKQWGEWKEAFHDEDGPKVHEVDCDSDEADALIASLDGRPGWISPEGRFFASKDAITEGTDARLMERVGKKAAGSLLDGREHKAMPELEV